MKELFISFVFAISCFVANAQRIVYSEPDRSDYRQTDFDIVGRFGSNILIFKDIRNSYAITVYDMDMKQIDKVRLEFLPDKIINPDFVAYPDFSYMFYQYQKRNVVYAMAAKLDGSGKIIGQPVTLDTTEISFLASNKIYSLINSDDKQYLSLIKINSKDDDNFLVTTLLYNKNLDSLGKQQLGIPMPGRHDFLTEFQVSNTGDIVFLRAIQEQENDKVQQLQLLIKRRNSSEVKTAQVDLLTVSLDDVRLKVDNYNNRYIITSFYSKTKRGNIDGLYTAMWSNTTDTFQAPKTLEFDDAFRDLAKGDNSMKTAFNDFYIKNLIVRKDGGFLLAAESLFTTGRGGPYNRYDYVYGSPFLRPMDYYMFPYGYGYGNPWNRYNNLGQSTRYNAQNIIVLSLDSTENLSWSNVISKNQYDDETDALISYSLVNTGDQLHFLFNQPERRTQLLTLQSISPSGQLTRSPTLRNLESGFDIMPRYGKQVGSRQIVFPCIYRNYLCFARLEL